MNRAEKRRQQKLAKIASKNDGPKQALDLAIQHHTAGRLPEAERIYQQILQADPNQPSALHLLGLIAHQMGKNDVAVTLIAKALAINPNDAVAHGNLGLALYSLARLDEAIACYRKALTLKPDFAMVHNNIGLALYDLARLDEAVTSYHKALAIEPNFAMAHNNLGNALKDLGQLEEAAASYHKALAIEPSVAVAHNNLGNALKGLGRLEEAVACYHNALAIKPDFAEAHSNLGNVLKDLGRLEEAVASYHNALAIKPNFVGVYNNLGNALKDLGRLDEAMVSYHKALAIEPSFGEAYSNLGNALKGLGRMDEAMASYHKALAINPNNAKAHNNLGLALYHLGRMDEAMASYHKALAIEPDFVEAHNNLGLALHHLGRTDEAVACYHKALAIEPDFVEAHNNLGNVLKDLGRMDEAMVSYRKTIAIKPNFAPAHCLLSSINQHTQYDDEIKAMEKLYLTHGTNEEQKIHLAFGLGKAFEDLKQFEKAFHYISEGNDMKRRTFEYDIDDARYYFETLKAVFTKDFLSQHGNAGIPDDTPVFILGMPRSGTTLTEQILASHPNIYGAGELIDLEMIVTRYFKRVGGSEFSHAVRTASPDMFRDAAQEYIKSLKKHSKDHLFITDKMPNNFALIGMIKLMFPNAKIIHCRRNPLDTCLSIFKNNFSVDAHHYAYSQHELGTYYKLYEDLMAHWRIVLPNFIYEIEYEDVIADQRKQTAALLKFCGLDWDDACLDFHKTERIVKTASAAQVRRPIYTASIKLWKQYEKELAPLREVLGT